MIETEDPWQYFERDSTAETFTVIEEVPLSFVTDEMKDQNGIFTKRMWLVTYSEQAVSLDMGVAITSSPNEEYHSPDRDVETGLLRLIQEGSEKEHRFYELSPISYLADLRDATHRLASTDQISIFEDTEEQSNLEYYIASDSGVCDLCGINDAKTGGVTHDKTIHTYHIGCFKKWQNKLSELLEEYEEDILVSCI